MSTETPNLFSMLPDKIFGPLSSPNRFHYWTLLCKLHHKRFGPEAPLPPSAGFHVKTIIDDIAEEIEFLEWLAEAEEGFDENQDLPKRADDVFRRLRDAGWFRIDRMGVREMVTMPTKVADFMNRLVNFAQKGPEYVSGKIHSIEANIKQIIENNGDGAQLKEVGDQIRSLIESIRIASINVRDMPASLIKEETTRDIITRFCEEYIQDMFIGDYRDLRTQNHPLSRRHEILKLVSIIQEDQEIRERMIKWFYDKQAKQNEKIAEELFERNIRRIQELSNIDEYLDRLDSEVCRTNNRFLAAVYYKIKVNCAVDELLERAIETVSTYDDDAIIDAPFPSGSALSEIRLAEPREIKERKPPKPLRTQVVSPEQRARAELYQLAHNRRVVTPEKLNRFIDNLLGDKQSINSTDIPTDTIERVRILQTLILLDMANNSRSIMLQRQALNFTKKYTTTRIQGGQRVNTGISHIPFKITRRRG